MPAKAGIQGIEQSVIRAMTAADLSAVYLIEQASHLFPWSLGVLRDCLAMEYACWVLEEAGQIKGFAMMLVAAQEGHVLNLCVEPQARRRGYARQLLQHLLERAKQQHADLVFLEVRQSNRAALALYEQMGFVQVGIRSDYYPAEHGREDAIMLALQLF